MWPYAIISVATYLLKNLVVWSYNTDKGTNMCIYVYGAIPYIHRTQKYYASVAAVALKPSFWQHNFAGLDMSSHGV